MKGKTPHVPFTVSWEIKERVRWFSKHNPEADWAFRIGRSAINGTAAGKSIHLFGYDKGILEEGSFCRLHGMRISLAKKDIRFLSGKELVGERRTLADGTIFHAIWVKGIPEKHRQKRSNAKGSLGGYGPENSRPKARSRR